MSTLVRARMAPGRSLNADAFADLTPSAFVTRWTSDGLLEVEFADDLPPATTKAVRLRLWADNPGQETLMRNLAAVLAETPTTSADRLARLERGVLGLIRLAVRDE